MFNSNFRAWPHIYKDGGSSKVFYGKIERNLTEDLTLLRSYDHREDSVEYTDILKQVLHKFGEGIHGSLTFTMKKYLRQTDGVLQNALREEWEMKATNHMFCHNNHAERPFAVARAFNRLYPALTLYNLSNLSHSMVNGTHRPEHIFGRTSVKNGMNMKSAGIALTAHPALRLAVNKLCSVRTRKVGNVTRLVREAYKEAVKAKDANRKRKAKEDFDERVRLKAKRAIIRDKADYTAHKELVMDVNDLTIQLLARKGNKKSRLAFLHEQYHARVSCGNPRIYPGLGTDPPFSPLRFLSLIREPHFFLHCRSRIPQYVRKATHYAQNSRGMHGSVPGTTH